jgi:polyhydroxyalkanoate synthesis regulator phasin
MAEKTRAGFTQRAPVGEFANTSTAVCSATVADAVQEVEREANVRMKCYDRWVAEGKMSLEEARKRMNAIVSAWHYLSDTEQAREAMLQWSASREDK